MAAEEIVQSTPAVAPMGRWSAYQIYALVLVTLIGVTSYVDRSVLAILQESIKHELKLSDLQLGFLSGPATTLFYAMLAIPVARLADRANRVIIITTAVAVWSSFTAACGLTANYVQIVLCRVGVGVGDSGLMAPSFSFISDYFSTRQRGIAMAIFNSCIPIGLLLGALTGGILAHAFGWRVAFFCVGAPGVVLGVIGRLTLKEPKRGQGESGERVVDDEGVPSFWQALKYLASNPTYVQLTLAGALIGFAVYGVNFLNASFFLRRFGLSLPQVALIAALGQGAAGVVGTYLGGWMAHHWDSLSGRSYPLVCAAGAIFSGVFFTLAYCANLWWIAAPVAIFANIGVAMKNGPSFAAVINIVPPRMRATASSVNLLGVALVGGALGPFGVGAISDLFAQHIFPSGLGVYHHLCAGGLAAPGVTAPGMNAACIHAASFGARNALIIASCVYFWSGLHYLLASRTIGRYWRV